MALSDKDIIITPNRGQTADPKIEFRGADGSTGAQTISLKTYPTSNGTISFEGSAGQLFSITNSLTGSIFSVNDISGIPSIEVTDAGVIRFAQYSGNVGIGVASPTYKLHVVGNAYISGTATFGTSSTFAGITSNTQVSTITGTIVSYVTPGLYANAVSSGNAIGIVSNTSFANNGAWANIALNQTTASANDITAGVHLTIGGWHQNSASGLPIYLGYGYVSEATPTMAIKPANASGGGNVGIGTVTPNAKLTIGTDFATTSGITVDSNSALDSQLILRKTTSKAAFSVMAWDSQAYIGVGLYYDNGGWVHHNSGTSSQLFAPSPGSGVVWYASSNSSASWNVADSVTLWDDSGAWKSLVQSTRSGNSYFTGGSVGVGTASPLDRLDIAGTTASNAGRIVFGDNAGYSPYIKFHKWTGSSTTYYQTTISNSVLIGGALEFFTGGGGANIGSDAQVLRMSILPTTGSVGIGTTAGGSSKLHVYGDSTQNQGLLKIENTIAAGTGYAAASFINVRGTHSYGTVAEFRTNTAGDSDRPSILFYGAQAAHSWTVGQVTSGWGSNDNFGIGYRASNTPSSFSAWPSNYFTIKTNGNVGIGVLDPAYILDVNNVGRFSSSSDSQLILRGTDTWAGLTFADSASTDYIWYHGTNATFAIGGGGANVAGKKLHVDGGMSIGSSYDSNTVPSNGLAIQGGIEIADYLTVGNSVTKSFALSFANAVANQAVDIRFPNDYINGYIEITLTSSYSNQNSVGKLTKLFSVGANPSNNIWNVTTSRIVEAEGVVADNWTIGNFAWDATNSKYIIPIYHIVSSGNTLNIEIKYYSQIGSTTPILPTTVLSSVYTTTIPAAFSTRHYAYYNDRLGVGITAPTSKLTVAGAIESRANVSDANYAAFLTGLYDSTHALRLGVKINSGTESEILGVFADSGGAVPRTIINPSNGWNVAVGTTTVAPEKLTVYGNIASTGGIAANYSGDSSTLGTGLSLWGSPTTTTSLSLFKRYDLLFGRANTAITEGAGSSGYATYHIMDTAGRGWVWRYISSNNTSTGYNVASLRNDSGQMTLGTGYNWANGYYAQLNISAGEGSATTYRDIDLHGGWAGGEGHAITATHGTGATDIVGQIVFQHDSPGSRIKFGRLYHSGNSTTAYPMQLVSIDTSSAYLTVNRDIYANGGASGNYGNRIIVGNTSTPQTIQDTNLRPTIYNYGAYPVITLDHTVTSNGAHGPTIQFAFNGLTTGGSTGRQIVIGAPGDGAYLDVGFSGGAWGTNSNLNPHNGISGYNGLVPLRIFSNGILVGSTGAYGSHITSITNALDVRGTSFLNYGVTTASSVTYGATAGQIFRNENSELAIGLLNASPYPLWIQGRNSSSAARDIVLQPSGGNVGIGTTSATARLTVYDGSAAAGWQYFYVSPSTAWGDGGTQYMTIPQIMLTNPHVTWASGNSAATIRMGRSGGVSSGAYYEVAVGSSDTFYINKNGAGNNFYINSSGNIGVANSNPTQKLHVNGAIRYTSNSSLDVTEYSGTVTGADNWPTCDAKARIYTIGTVNSVPGYYSYIEVEVIGSHRGYATSTYREYKKWIITLGDQISSRLVFSDGAENRVGMWNGTDATGWKGANGPHSSSGAVLKLIVNPSCGAGYVYTVKVKYAGAVITHGDFSYVDHSVQSVTVPYSQFWLNGDSVILGRETGNVGIGDSSLAYKLDVAGDIRATGTVRSNNNLISSYAVYALSTITGGYYLSDSNFTTQAWIFIANSKLSINAYNSAKSVEINATANQPLYLQNNSNGNVLISGTGNLGIGQTAPTQKLHFGANSFIALPGAFGYTPTSWQRGYSGIILAGSGNADGSGWSYGSRIINIDRGDGLNLEFDVNYTNSWTDSALVISGRAGRLGYVGIGQIAPAYKLDVSGDIRATGTIYGTLSGNASNGFTTKPSWAGNTNLIAGLGNFNNSVPSGFYEGYQSTNAPSATWYNLLNVRHSNTANDHGFQLTMSYYDNKLYYRTYQGGSGNNDGTFTSWARSLDTTNDVYPSNMNQYVRNSDNVQFNSLGIGTGASNTAGEIRATNNITAYYSDERLKTRLGAIENPIQKIKSLSGFYFEANETAQQLGYEKKREVGVSAQEVQAVMPEIIAPAPINDKYLTVRYEKLIPLLIEAIKEQQIQIESLKTELNKLR